MGGVMANARRGPKVYTIEVTGKPVAKGRGRVGLVHGRPMIFTPKNTRVWEKDARTVARQVMGPDDPLQGSIQIIVRAVFPIAASWPTWKREMALAGTLAHTSKPDGDNVLKAMKDALNGVVYLDDSQVTKGAYIKEFGDRPMVRAVVKQLEGYPSQTSKNPNKGE